MVRIMLIFLKQSLVFIAVPKTGTTAIETALSRKADIILARDRKHLTAQRFHRQIAPFLDKTFGATPDRFAVIRHPEEQLRSWYRYRMRDSLKDPKRTTHFLSFDQFVQDVLSDQSPRHARIGSQFRILTSARKALLVHHLFAYEQPEKLAAFLQDRFGETFSLKRKNVSPPVDAPLSDDLRARLEAERRDEYALYEKVVAAGGHLVNQI